MCKLDIHPPKQDEICVMMSFDVYLESDDESGEEFNVSDTDEDGDDCLDETIPDFQHTVRPTGDMDVKSLFKMFVTDVMPDHIVELMSFSPMY